MTWLRQQDEACVVDVYVAPRASRTRVVGEHGGRLKVQLAAPPVDGAANDELVALFRQLTGVARADIELSAGHQSKRKSVRIAGVEPDDLRRKLLQE